MTDAERIKKLELEVHELRRANAALFAFLLNQHGGAEALKTVRARAAGGLVNGALYASPEELFRMIEDQL